MEALFVAFLALTTITIVGAPVWALWDMGQFSPAEWRAAGRKRSSWNVNILMFSLPAVAIYALVVRKHLTRSRHHLGHGSSAKRPR